MRCTSVLTCLLFGGCGGAVTVTGRVVQAASIPVRTFPRVWVASGHLDHEIVLAETLVGHLADRDRQTRRLGVDELEPLRTRGSIPPATAVVLLDLQLEEDERTEIGSDPDTVCGAFGCYTTHRTFVYRIPTLRGVLTVRVYDGQSARVLNESTIRLREEGRPSAEMRARITRAFSERLVQLVDRRELHVEVDLLDVDLPSVSRAIAAIERGNWSRGRAGFEEGLASPQFQSLPPEQRARVHYDLGVALRFDPDAPDFERAKQCFEAAERLDPDERYGRALTDLAMHRVQVEAVRAQEEAAARNAQAATGESAVPEPPASYQQSLPPPP